jgi:hypothetical protein
MVSSEPPLKIFAIHSSAISVVNVTADAIHTLLLISMNVSATDFSLILFALYID